MMLWYIVQYTFQIVFCFFEVILVFVADSCIFVTCLRIMKKTATCFGGAMNIINTPQYQDSIEIGAWLADHGYIVKTGGYKGIMEAFSKGAGEQGGHVVGCTCESFGPQAIPNKYVSEERKSKNLYGRLKRLIEEEDAYRIFIYQVGGAGTLTELMICLDLFRKLKQAPPMYLIGDHYHQIIEAIKPYMNEREHSLVTVVSNKEELYQHILEDESKNLATSGES